MFIAMQLTFALTHTIFGREMIVVGHGNWYLYLSLIWWNSTRSVLHLSCILIVSKLCVCSGKPTDLSLQKYWMKAVSPWWTIMSQCLWFLWKEKMLTGLIKSNSAHYSMAKPSVIPTSSPWIMADCMKVAFWKREKIIQSAVYQWSFSYLDKLDFTKLKPMSGHQNNITKQVNQTQINHKCPISNFSLFNRCLIVL